MTEHLTDMQIALLSTGRGSEALRAGLAAHLANCAECAERLAACVRWEREFTAFSAGSAAERAAESAPGPAARERLRAAFASSAGASATGRGAIVRRLRPLLERLPDLGASRNEPLFAPMAADDRGGSAAAGEVDLPILATEDHALLVRFRRLGSSGRVRGYVIARKGALPGRLALRLPGRDLSFPVSAEGEIDLPEISLDELAAGRIEISLIELPDGDGTGD